MEVVVSWSSRIEAELEATKKHAIGAYAIYKLDPSRSIAAPLVESQFEKHGRQHSAPRSLIDPVMLDQVRATAELLSAEPPLWSSARRWGQRMSPAAQFAFLLPLLGELNSVR
ncbi:MULTISPECIES: hypothetical protein [Mesorhizobium]|uniref:hypothetical protein n=1 Tax=Mesorhizobium TaxID=68287 RepID=UPI0007FDB1AB|nr:MULTISPECIES: hypothetical protein [Mesorhizobium]MUT27212.1 hypothetical protein [Mesorhizobium japonicum]OBQ84921.1 hypothetical protein A9K71_21450 [Mesorhizobium sp. WSM3873]